MGKGKEVIEVEAPYTKDTPKKCRYDIAENEYGISGSLYIEKSADVPDEFMVTLGEK